MVPVLLYDDTCGFCAGSVQFVLKRDRRGTLRFASLYGSFGEAVRARHPQITGVDSMLWVEPAAAGGERVFARSAAVLRLSAYLGGIWRLLLLGHLLPASARDALYAFIARHRHQIAGARDRCLAVSPDVRQRFLD
jgi:predicted DCC family thiol-disulfide oxidoreductase YuxK